MYKKSSPLAWRNSKDRIRLASDTSMKGTVESFTVVHIAPKGFERNVPYTLALILLNNGKKVISQVVDAKNLAIGAKVEPCLRRAYTASNEGIIQYGTKFRVSK